MNEKTEKTEMTDARQRKANVRLAIILASISLVFLIGFVTRMAWFGN